MPKFNIEKSILVDVPVAKAFAVVRDFNSWNNPHLGGFAAKKQIPIIIVSGQHAGGLSRPFETQPSGQNP